MLREACKCMNAGPLLRTRPWIPVSGAVFYLWLERAPLLHAILLSNSTISSSSLLPLPSNLLLWAPPTSILSTARRHAAAFLHPGARGACVEHGNQLGKQLLKGRRLHPTTAARCCERWQVKLSRSYGIQLEWPKNWCNSDFYCLFTEGSFSAGTQGSLSTSMYASSLQRGSAMRFSARLGLSRQRF